MTLAGNAKLVKDAAYMLAAWDHNGDGDVEVHTQDIVRASAIIGLAVEAIGCPECSKLEARCAALEAENARLKAEA